MLIQPVDYFLLVWFVLVALSSAYVAYDQFKNNPEPAVMKWGFVSSTAYPTDAVKIGDVIWTRSK